jgi:transcription initiation factor TFIIIB Brf1 subunit/transcription initiation factor TFIIB
MTEWGVRSSAFVCKCCPCHAKYPLIAYGTDWLAFGHMALRRRSPLKGMIACIDVPFLALIAGPIRGIPFGWRPIDGTFGLVDIFPLRCIIRDIEILELGSNR